MPPSATTIPSADAPDEERQYGHEGDCGRRDQVVTGTERYCSRIRQRGRGPGGRRPDTERLRALIRLLQRGVERQVVLSMDITGAELHSNPGTIGRHGYAFLHTQILPLLKAKGIRESVLDVMLVDNPARILTIG